MENQIKKKVLTWETHTDGKTGSFKCKLNQDTVLSTIISGTTKDGKPYSYPAFITDELSGNIIWLDAIEGKFSKSLRIVLDSGNGYVQLDLQLNSKNLNAILSPILTLGKDFYKGSISIKHVLIHKDKEGKLIMSKDGSKAQPKRFIFMSQNGQNIKHFYSQENPKPQEIAWVKGLNGFDDSKEIVFWVNKIHKLQEALIKAKVALPLSYGSMIYTSAESQFFKIISPEALEAGNELYKAKRDTFQYINSSGSSKSSNDFFSDDAYKAPSQVESSHKSVASKLSSEALENEYLNTNDDDIFGDSSIDSDVMSDDLPF